MHWGRTLGVITLLCLAVLGVSGIGTVAASDPGGAGEDDGTWLNESAVEDDEWEDRAPYVDAGLDQESYVGTEVLLDGAGTWDDQDDIVHTAWSIETPAGATIEPNCPGCWFTSFTPSEVGEYSVTLTVKDSEGHENTDTLYVEVEPLETEMLSPGPAAVDAGGSTTGGGDGCYMAHARGDDRHQGGCATHGRFTGFEFNEEGHVTGYTFEDEGVVEQYSEKDYDENGSVIVSLQTVKNELETVWNNPEDDNGDLDHKENALTEEGAKELTEAWGGSDYDNSHRASGGGGDSNGGDPSGGGDNSGRCGGCHW